MTVRRIFVGIIIIVILIGGGLFWHYHHGAATADVTHRIPPPPPPPPAPTLNTGPSEAQLELGFIAKGSGGSQWLAITRQLRADPKSWGYAKDLNDEKALTKWVNHEAMTMLIEDGKYYHGVGDEVRTYGDVSYVLQKDPTGKVQIAEYVVTTSPAAGRTITIDGKTLSLSLGMTDTLASSVATSHFFGASPTTGEKLPVPYWEYVYFPHG
jgi:hypothetical protein